MERKVKPGITFYRMDSGHIRNKKVRLLMNEFDSDGYYIWRCLLDYSYLTWGYYFDLNDKDDLELFASEYCRKKLGLIQEVIAGCLRRGLFNRTVAELSGILTHEMMQETFVYATSDRRKKGTSFEMRKDWLLIDFDGKIPENLVLVPGKKDENHGKIPQTKTKTETKTKIQTEIKKKKVAPAEPSPAQRIKQVREKIKKEAVIEEPEPFWQSLVEVWFDFNRKEFGDEPSFQRDEPKILKRIIQLLKKRAATKNEPWTEETAPVRFKNFLDKAFKQKWLNENFLLSNLEKQFDKIILIAKDKKDVPAHQNGNSGDLIETIKYLYGRYCEGELDERLVLPEHYDKMISYNILPVNFLKNYEGDTIDEQKKNSVLGYFKSQKEKLQEA